MSSCFKIKLFQNSILLTKLRQFGHVRPINSFFSLDPNQFRISEFKNIYRRMVSINDDPDLQTLIVPQCGLTCVDLKELERGVKVSHLEKLFPYLEKHIDASHLQSCLDDENTEKTKSCRSVTRRELKRMVKSMGKDKNGVLSMDEFCEFLSQLDDCVKDKCEDPNAVMKVVIFRLYTTLN